MSGNVGRTDPAVEGQQKVIGDAPPPASDPVRTPGASDKPADQDNAAGRPAVLIVGGLGEWLPLRSYHDEEALKRKLIG